MLWKPYCRFGVVTMMTSLRPAVHLAPGQTANKATIRWRGEKTQGDIMGSSSHFLSALTLMLLRGNAGRPAEAARRAQRRHDTQVGAQGQWKARRSQCAEDNAALWRSPRAGQCQASLLKSPQPQLIITRMFEFLQEHPIVFCFFGGLMMLVYYIPSFSPCNMLISLMILYLTPWLIVNVLVATHKSRWLPCPLHL